MVLSENLILDIVHPARHPARRAKGRGRGDKLQSTIRCVSLAKGDLSAVLAGRLACGRHQHAHQRLDGARRQTTKVKGCSCGRADREVARAIPELGARAPRVRAKNEQGRDDAPMLSADAEDGFAQTIAEKQASVNKASRGRVISLRRLTAKRRQVSADERPAGRRGAMQSRTCAPSNRSTRDGRLVICGRQVLT